MGFTFNCKSPVMYIVNIITATGIQKMIRFTKMHGTGNDYIYIDAEREQIKNIKKLAISMSSRNFGVGSDGLILILPSDIADFKMRMFNSDGSEAEMCGNGIRCFAKYVFEHGLTDKKNLSVETLGGIKNLVLSVKRDIVNSVMVDMGEPVFQRERIPMIGDPGMVISEPLHLDDGITFEITSLSMGNPHVVIFVEDIEHFPVEKYGSMIENHHFFPQRTNVEFIQVINSREVSQRTWERGAGETLSCGTGASAVTAACVLNKKTEREITIHLRGGDLSTEWREQDNHIYMTGPAHEVFEGTWKE